MNVTVVSLARDLGIWCDPFIVACKALTGATFKFVIVEGDSVDDTPARLAQWAKDDKRVTIITHNTGAKKHGHTLDRVRMEHISSLANIGLDEAIRGKPDYILMTPSDVEFEGDIVKRLLSHKVDYVAPMFWTRSGNHTRFYDIWGFTQGGAQWRPLPKAWYATHLDDSLVEMSTVGGMALIKAKYINDGARYSPVDCDRGLCRAAQELGAKVWADPTTHIYHR